VPCG